MSKPTTWNDIKQLAADFQRIQLVESSYKLSERNCIEIINKLVEMKLLNNICHTIDGKEYVTEKQVDKEIYDELYVHDGRVNIVDLQTLLNVDIGYIEQRIVNQIVANDPDVSLILGQLISKDYINKISEEINELLQERGHLTITELTNLYELPVEFVLQHVITAKLNTIIRGNFDGHILYTHHYVQNQKALLAGALEACIRPTRIQNLIKEYNLNSTMIFDIYDELISSNELNGSLIGGSRQDVSSTVYVPNVFKKAQEQYTMAFFKQNGYLEYSKLKSIGISDPSTYVKSLFSKQNEEFGINTITCIKYLENSCIGTYFLDQLRDECEEQLNKRGLCNLALLFPSMLNEKDLCTMIAQFGETLADTQMMADHYLLRKQFLKSLGQYFEQLMQAQAEQDLRKEHYVLAIRTENVMIGYLNDRDVTAEDVETGGGGKSKSKKSKKSTPVVEQHQQQQEFVEIVFMNKRDLGKKLKQMLKDFKKSQNKEDEDTEEDQEEDELLEALNEHFLRPVNKQYLELLKKKIEIGLATTAKDKQSTPNKKSTTDQKKDTGSAITTIKDMQQRIILFLINAKIFDKTNKSLQTDQKLFQQLDKYLLKSNCTEITNDMLKFIANEQLLNSGNPQQQQEILNPETRLKLIQKLKEPHKQKFQELHQSLNLHSSSEVIELIEKMAVDLFELTMKKINDPKREKEVLLELRETTKVKLEAETSSSETAATVLHLVVVLVYNQMHHQQMILNTPGKCLPSIIEAASFKTKMNENSFQLIHRVQSIE